VLAIAIDGACSHASNRKNDSHLVLTRMAQRKEPRFWSIQVLCDLGARHPGQLTGILGLVAERSMNICHVEHRCGELSVPVGMTEITLQIETRGAAHQEKLIEHFARQGVAVGGGETGM
jgi:hypothetical protein